MRRLPVKSDRRDRLMRRTQGKVVRTMGSVQRRRDRAADVGVRKPLHLGYDPDTGKHRFGVGNSAPGEGVLADSISIGTVGSGSHVQLTMSKDGRGVATVNSKPNFRGLINEALLGGEGGLIPPGDGLPGSTGRFGGRGGDPDNDESEGDDPTGDPNEELVSYSCNYQTGQCEVVQGFGGQYATLAECQNACVLFVPGSCDGSPYDITDVNVTTVGGTVLQYTEFSSYGPVELFLDGDLGNGAFNALRVRHRDYVSGAGPSATQTEDLRAVAPSSSNLKFTGVTWTATRQDGLPDTPENCPTA